MPLADLKIPQIANNRKRLRVFAEGFSQFAAELCASTLPLKLRERRYGCELIQNPSRLRSNSHFHYPIPAFSKEIVGFTNLVQRESVRNQRTEIDATMTNNLH